MCDRENVELHLRGSLSAEYRAQLDVLAGRHGVTARVFFYSQVDHDELIRTIAGFDIGLALERPDDPNYSLTVTNNTFIGCKPGGSCAGTLVATSHCSTSGPLGTIWSWTGNKQYRDPASDSWNYFVSPACTTYSQQQTFTTWKNGTQLGLSDQTFSTAPTSQQVFSWGTSFDPNRATVVVYNWTGAGAFTVDLTGKLAAGTYRVFNVMNLSAPVGSPVTYGGSGSITLPISLVTPTNPIGSPFDPPFADDINFNVYILRP